MMKKTLSVLVLALMLVTTLGFASAVTAPETIIAGKIYNSDYTAVVPGATVTVTCNGNVLTATSLPDGAYKVKYIGNCLVGNSLSVYAQKDALTGLKTGTIKAEGTCADPSTDNCLINVYEGLDVAVVNVPLVPEFGTMIGVLTALGALGVFFLVRRK
jgi:hypothetical protein